MKDRIFDKFISFDNLLGITSITIALVAAFFSVYGIATLFSGAFTLTAIMATSLEIGKLVAVTFLYRYWKQTHKFLKTYLGIATLVLMLITSIGIFGYLSAAYQQSASEFKSNQDKIEMVEGQKPYLIDKIDQSNTRIKTLNEMRKMQESRLSDALTNAFLSRNPIQLKQIQDQTVEIIKASDSDIKMEQDKIQKTMDEIASIDKQVNELKFSSANKKDIRTFQFVADQFNTTLDNVAKWFIFTIIFVFDPLSIALILAYNVVTYKKSAENIASKISENNNDTNKIDQLPLVDFSSNVSSSISPPEPWPRVASTSPDKDTNHTSSNSNSNPAFTDSQNELPRPGWL